VYAAVAILVIGLGILGAVVSLNNPKELPPPAVSPVKSAPAPALQAPFVGEAQIGYAKPVTTVDRGKRMVVTKIEVKNLSGGAIAGFKVEEFWFDRVGNPIVGNTFKNPTPFEAGATLTITLDTPLNPLMFENTYQFSHANGKVRTRLLDSVGSSATTSAAPSVPAATSKAVSGDNRFGCSSREHFEKLAKYAAQRDGEAFAQGLGLGVSAGQCTMFKNGEAVHIANTALLSGLVKVRRVGDLQEFWTNLEAVK
jgi:hypothetical protein